MRFHQEDTLRRIMDRVTSELGVVIERFRADCGSFSKEIIQTVEQRCNTFYIRAANSDSRCEDFRQLKEWKSVEVGYERCDVTSVSIDNLIEGKSYRLVVLRSPLKDMDGKQQTNRETTFAGAEMPNLLRNDLREPRKHQTLFRMSKCYKIMLFLNSAA